MIWKSLKISPQRSHHIFADGTPAYEAHFDDVLKFHAPGLAPVRLGGEAWHIHPDGSPAYSRRFLATFGYYDGLAAVTTPRGWCHIDARGEPAYEARHAWCGNFQQERCPVRDAQGLYHHITPTGAPLHDTRWRYAGDYRDDVAVVQRGDGRSSHIDPAGALLHDRWFLDLDVFHKGCARARDEEGWTHVDGDGRPLYARRFAAVEPFYNGQARVETFEGALHVIDERGETLVELRGPQRSEFSSLSGDLVGFWRTQTIAAGVSTGLIEALPSTSSDAATRCQLREEGAWRLLRALGELGLVRRAGEVWQLTSRGELLRGDHPLTLADAALEYAAPLSQAWRALPEALAARSSWRPPLIFHEVADDRERCEAHHRMLRSYARHDYPEVVRTITLPEGARVIDAGGGSGTLATLLLEANPSAHVTVLDLPGVVELDHDADDGLTRKGGDLFEPWGLTADVIVLARVLHDWDDALAVNILARARQALAPGGRVLIIEMMAPDEGVAGGMCDLHLLMATGGQERSASHYEKLLRAADFTSSGVRRVNALTSILEGVRS